MSGPSWVAMVCVQCGAGYERRPSQASHSSYCSPSCRVEHYKTRMAGAGNPNFRNAGWHSCAGCGAEFHSYATKAKYCTHACYVRTSDIGSTGGRPVRDANHLPILNALIAAGIECHDLSERGHGCPDILARGPLGSRLMEVKNASNSYGRSGMSAAQIAWADNWKGARPVVVHDVHEAFRALGLK